MSILEINNCTICYQNGHPAVSKVSLSVNEGEIISIVGESGSGKTTLIRAILGLLPSGGKVTEGKILFGGQDLVKASELQLEDIRGKEIAMIFQDVGAALDPINQIKHQYNEAISVHEKLPRAKNFDKAMQMLKKVKLNDPKRVMNSYPFELSGGMKQRVGIAMGMTAKPKLLLADEPTSALDVTIQAQVVQQLKELRDKYGVTIILVTHNMGIASYLSDKIGVMKKSELLEFGSRDEIIYHPKTEYTKQLLEAVPKLGADRFAKEYEPSAALLTMESLYKRFPVKKKTLQAVSDINLTLHKGEILGIVGESGCGKSTLAKMVSGTYPISEGKIYLNDTEYSSLKGRKKREFRRNIQVVFQDPLSSFSPRMKIGTYIAEPRRNYDHIPKNMALKEAANLLKMVNLPEDFLSRYPHELSGGQLQRVAIARAIAMKPSLLICDEATGALDVSIQNQVARLLVELVEENHMSCLFIGHDLALVRSVSHRIAIMYLGRIVEVLESENLEEKNRHPYTRALLDSIFDVYCDQNIAVKLLKGEPPSPLNLPDGCAFADRCPRCTERCRQEIPVLKEIEPGHLVACFHIND